MRYLLLVALLVPSTALGATTGTVTVLLLNSGRGSFGATDPIRVTADGDVDGFDKSVNAPATGTALPGLGFTAAVTGLYAYDSAGTYTFVATFPDGSGTRTVSLATNVQFPGAGPYWLSTKGITTGNPGSSFGFSVGNSAPDSYAISGCSPSAPNPTQNLAVSWSVGTSAPADFEKYTLQRAPQTGLTFTNVATYTSWGTASFTDTNLTASTTYRYRVVHQDRYDATTTSAVVTCTTSNGDADGDGHVSTAYGGDDCNDANATVYKGATELADDGIDQDCDTVDLVLVPALDSDLDGALETADNCPTVANADQANLDGDLSGDACDPDDDNDGVADTVDICPTSYDPTQADLDGDLSGDACDLDDDDDGVDDDTDVCPRVSDPDQFDLDFDTYGDACDGDDDGDGVSDLADVCPDIPDPDQADADGDAIGDACDPDTDADGILNDEDNCPSDANAEQLDTDADEAGDACDVDSDNDGVGDDLDLCPVNADPFQEDADADSLGNACDEDDDNDAVVDEDDNCVFDANATQADLDADGLGDACDDDDDDDGVDDAADNCVTESNSDQHDNDADGAGDACDTDDDDDTVADIADNCPSLANLDQADLDGDAVGDVCDSDDDDDLAFDFSDNCPVDWNEDQLDTDADGLGDTCDPDDDDDTILDAVDLCSTVADLAQADADCDGSGDACDDDIDGDDIANVLDDCPDDAAYPIELVEDGCPDDACDLVTYIRGRTTSEIAAQTTNSLAVKASGACTNLGTQEGINKLEALASELAAQRGKKVAPTTADLLLGSIEWIETAWTCDQTGVGCELLDVCGE
ncbi:MAG: thrombospondin type 3 repeat-containing protein [Pseudomonadota bacterium]|nr:thrombospondin type 3 repeat-containing protein [Pseudomonadota bacterium]